MFGNQQNRQAESNAGPSYTSNAEKSKERAKGASVRGKCIGVNPLARCAVTGTLSASGLGGLKAALAEEEKPLHSKTPSNTLYDRESFSPYDKSYE